MIPGLSSGELKKMEIKSYVNEDYSGLEEIFVVMFNPNQFTQKFALELQDRTAAGEGPQSPVYNLTPPQEMTFEFLIDGTGTAVPAVPGGIGVALPGIGDAVNAATEEVSDIVDRFLGITYKSDIESHRPRYLILNWGILHFQCILKSAEVSYVLFKPDGQPLRAKINATFLEHVPEAIRREKLFRSPDLTRYRSVEEGDNLPRLAEAVYEDPAYYLQLAKVNGLNHFRRLRTGSQLRMPPLRSTQEPAES